MEVKINLSAIELPSINFIGNTQHDDEVLANIKDLQTFVTDILEKVYLAIDKTKNHNEDSAIEIRLALENLLYEAARYNFYLNNKDDDFIQKPNDVVSALKDIQETIENEFYTLNGNLGYMQGYQENIGN